MSLLAKIFGIRPTVDVMRAALFMEYNPLIGVGTASVQWIPLAVDDDLRPFLIALLYTRILSVHSPARTKLFHIVNDLSSCNINDGGNTGWDFPDWPLELGLGMPVQAIWPWIIRKDPALLSKAKLYQATLQVASKSYGEPNVDLHFTLHLTMAFGQQRILAPAAPLIAITSYVEESDREGCYQLALLLWHINKFYKSPDNIQIGSESVALATAMKAIGGLDT